MQINLVKQIKALILGLYYFITKNIFKMKIKHSTAAEIDIDYVVQYDSNGKATGATSQKFVTDNENNTSEPEGGAESIALDADQLVALQTAIDTAAANYLKTLVDPATQA